MAKVIADTTDMPYDKWLEYRKMGIGGSDASVVCGINKYKSPIELWMEKTDQLPYQEAGEAAYWGSVLEDIVRSEFTKRTGIDVQIVKQLLQSKEYPFMQANLDGICESPEYGTCIFEAKTASAYKANEWDNSIPAEYMLQIQHYMAVTGYKGTYIAVLIGGNTFKWKFVERDEEIIAMLVNLEADFWDHVTSLTPPPIDGTDACAKFIAERYSDSVSGSRVDLQDKAERLLLEYDEAAELLNAATERKQKAENQLKELLGANEVGICGNRIISWKTTVQERLDSKLLKSEQPELFKQYLNQISFRKFTVKAV